ncbi:S1 family peptidase, partial [Streptomyces beijiangensis]|uniref:S1 family peptidase n=1 Tax=Streptomyces beijiangensis TaxID=163361 RepID=UPI001F5D35CF
MEALSVSVCRALVSSLSEFWTILARQTLTDKASIGGTSWAIDPVSNKMVVTADRTVSGAELTRLSGVVKGLGS